MLDARLRPLIDPVLDRMAAGLAARGITANQVTVAGFLVGLAAAVAIFLEANVAGLALLLVSRLCDGLDGAVARAGAKTDFGGYLDIVLDFGFYGAIPLGFVLADPPGNAVAGAMLLLAFYFNGASFLAYAAIAEKRGIKANERGLKSIFFTTGLAEATETMVVFCAMCLFPAYFPALAFCFAAVCFYTAASRIVLARNMFG